MPTIKQLPAATALAGGDLLPVSQNGLTRSATISTLLSNTQPLISVGQGTLLGRVSNNLGGPEAVNIGTGLSIRSGVLVATGNDHAAFIVAATLSSDDEVVLNSNSTPKRLPATQLRSLFSAGTGVQIDNSGVISVTSSSGATGGAPGPKGDTGAQGPAGQGFSFRGAWQAGTVYFAYDVITANGQTYLATATIPSASTFISSAWSLIAAQGANGSSGPTVPATSTLVGAVKPGSGLAVSTDGTLSISGVTLAAISQGGATVGQLLGWTGTGWSPTTPASGVSFTGSSPISVVSGVVSLAQSGASTGQVLAWSGTAWGPMQLPASGAMTGNAVPLSDGVATAGSAITASREDHRHATDVTRAPLSNPVFTTAITLPVWTTSTRPSSPTLGMEGFNSDGSRRETYTASGWTQYVRVGDLSAGVGQLLGGSASVGSATAITVGSGLSLTGTTLSATASPSTSAISGVSIDGAAIPGSTTVPYQMLSTDRVVDVNKSSGSASRIILPSAPVLWVDYTIIDGRGDAGTNNISIVLSPGGTINGQTIFVMNANFDAITLRAVSATVWRIA